MLLHLEVVSHLKIHPEVLRGPKIASQSQGRVRRNPTCSMDNLIDSTWWHTDVLRESVLSSPERLQKLLFENLPRVNRRMGMANHHSLLPSDSRKSPLRMRRLPKADPPLVVHSDTVLARTICSEALEAVPWRNAEVFKAHGCVQDQQLSVRASL